MDKELITRIKTRDNYVCFVCVVQETTNETLHVHHIDSNRANSIPKNLITLCKKCHGSAHKLEREYFWVKYFQNNLANKFGYEYDFENIDKKIIATNLPVRVDKKILLILQRISKSFSAHEIVLKNLNNDNPFLIPYRRELSRVRYHLKVLVEEGKVKREKIKNGYVYSII